MTTLDVSAVDLSGLTATQLRLLSARAEQEAGRRACTARLDRLGYCAGDAGHPPPHYLIAECTFHGTSSQGALVRVQWDDSPAESSPSPE